MQEITDFLANASIVDLLIAITIKLVIAVVIFVIGRWVAGFLQKMLEKLMRKREVDEVLVDFLGTISYTVVILVAVVAAIDFLGIPATSLVAVLGAAGLAIGLALKDSLSNFAAGVMLVLFRPFTKGDYVEAAGIAGTVDEVYLVNTRLVTPDNKVVTVPNAAVWNDSITNYSAKDTRRLDMVFGVGYDDDLKLAAEVLMKVCKANDKVLADPDVNIFVTNLGDSSVDFAVRPWVKSEDYWGARAEIMGVAKVELEAAGLSIPYPQSDVHMHNADSSSE